MIFDTVWLVRTVAGLVLAAAILCVGCGSDDGENIPDADVPDARLGFDANENLIDAGPTTSCGEPPNQIECDMTIEVCVLTDTGGSLQPSCETCDQDVRDCASCHQLCGALTCGDSDDENTIECF